MKSTEQFFPVVLFIMLYKVVVTFESLTIDIKTTKQFFPVVLFMMILKFDQLTES